MLLSELRKRVVSHTIRITVRNESISVGSVRAGMILKLDNCYVEVKKYEPKREGRGGAMGAIEYVDLLSAKIGRVKLGVQQRIESMLVLFNEIYTAEPELEKQRLTVQYVDKERGIVVASDESYEEHEIPIKLVQGAETLLEPGTSLSLARDGSVPVKVSLPATLMAEIRKQ